MSMAKKVLVLLGWMTTGHEKEGAIEQLEEQLRNEPDADRRQALKSSLDYEANDEQWT